MQSAHPTEGIQQVPHLKMVIPLNPPFIFVKNKKKYVFCIFQCNIFNGYIFCNKTCYLNISLKEQGHLESNTNRQ